MCAQSWRCSTQAVGWGQTQAEFSFHSAVIALAKRHLRYIWSMHPWVNKTTQNPKYSGWEKPASTEHVAVFFVIRPTAGFSRPHSIIAEINANSNLGML